MSTEMPSRRAGVSGWRPRLALFALFALFFVPIIGAFVLNALAPSWLPFGRVNHGELVQPAQPAALDTMQVLDGIRWSESVALSPWTLLHVGEPVCVQVCQQALVSMRQARLALGKDADRVSRWWLMTVPPDPHSVTLARAIDPGLRIGLLDRGVSVLTAPDPVGLVQLVDPAGYLILRYHEADSASAILKDLKRLLRISTQG